MSKGRTLSLIALAGVLALAAFAVSAYLAGRDRRTGPSAFKMPEQFVQIKLVISASMFAELEPCGCTRHQRGGFSRRATLYNEISTAGPALFLDGGQSVSPLLPLKSRGLAEVSRARADLAWDFLDSVPCDAIGIGDQDLLADRLLSFLTPERARRIVASNLRGRDLPFQRWSVVRAAGGLKLGVVTLFDEACLRRTGLDGRGYAAEPPEIVLKELLKSEDRPDFLVVFSYCDDGNASKRLAEAFPEVKVVVENPGGVPQKVGRVRTLNGKAIAITPRAFGTHAVILNCFAAKRGGDGSVLDLSRMMALEEIIRSDRKRYRETYEKELGRLKRAAESASWLYLFDEKPVDVKIAPDPAWEMRILRFKEESADAARLLRSGGGEKRRLVYVPAGNCKACHEPEYRQWAGTKHAHAFATLQKANAARNAECISCHATGFLEPGGIASFEELEVFKNVQCMSCHQPDPEKAHPAEFHFPKVTRAACLECHTPNNSPDFDFENYLPKATCQPSAGEKPH